MEYQSQYINPFPVELLVRDFDMPSSWNENIDLFIRTEVFSEHPLFDPNDPNKFDEINIFSPKFLEKSKEVQILYDIFFNGFKDLAHHTDPDVSAESIEKMHFTGKVPFMKSGDFKKVHNHVKADAYGIFYLNDIPPKSGGQLIIHHPVFHNQVAFSAPREHTIPHRKNRLIIGPSYVWHEVSLYLGKDQRKVISADCNLFWV